MRLGVHVSISGNLGLAAERGNHVGCEAMQIFTSNPKGWVFKTRSDDELAEFKVKTARYSISPVYGHSIYLTNLASPNPFIYTNSINSLVAGLTLAKKAGLTGVITHIGSHAGTGTEEGKKRVINALAQIIEITKGEVPILLETDAGSGNHLGADFAEIGGLISSVGSNSVKVCLDTAHVFAAGYDIRTEKGIEKTLEEFEKYIGLDRLQVIHLNDSRGTLGSKVDRHEEIGKGEIGLNAFTYLINHSRLKNLAGILETPENKDTERTEKLGLDILKELRR